MLLLCSLTFRLKELFQVKNGNGLSTSLLFFFEIAKHLGRSDDVKRRKKKRMALQNCGTFHAFREEKIADLLPSYQERYEYEA